MLIICVLLNLYVFRMLFMPSVDECFGPSVNNVSRVQEGLGELAALEVGPSVSQSSCLLVPWTSVLLFRLTPSQLLMDCPVKAMAGR